MNASTSNSELVSVVIPAFNAEATLDETLRSVRGQTHRNLEVIVVDDGSRDRTVAIAQCHATDDQRVRIIRQTNAGVAAARNNGWRQARSDLIAFLDADDLWAPEKIERQLRALRDGGQRVGLVYSWYAVIDGASRITGRWKGPKWEGDVLERLFTNNFVGNGSATLVRRQALIDADGFEPSLREAGAEGCEDILFYCRVAERHHFAVVPDHLVGYRRLRGNMSSDLPQMLRSRILVVDEMALRHPDKHAALRAGLRYYGDHLLRRAVFLREIRHIVPLVTIMLSRSPWNALRMAFVKLPYNLIALVMPRLRKLRRGGIPAEPEKFRIGSI